MTTRLNIVPLPSAGAAREAPIGGNVVAAMLTLGDAIGALRDGTLGGLECGNACGTSWRPLSISRWLAGSHREW